MNMNPIELSKALTDAVAPLGKDARATIVISSGGDSKVYASAEAGWQTDADRLKGYHYADLETALAKITQWVAEAPMRNRVATAADLGLPDDPTDDRGRGYGAADLMAAE